MTRRERRTFEALVEAAVAPASVGLPHVSETDAVVAFERYLEVCPAPGRAGLRFALAALERAPLVTGPGRVRGFHSMPETQRLEVLERLGRGALDGPVKALVGLAQLFYYGDQEVASIVGYDAGGRVARGASLRAEQGRW